jgi:hypothetical protein
MSPKMDRVSPITASGVIPLESSATNLARRKETGEETDDLVDGANVGENGLQLHPLAGIELGLVHRFVDH